MEADHDILIDSRRKIITLCEKVDKLTEKFDKREEHCDVCKGSIYKEIGDVDKRNFKKDMAMWIIGAIFLLIGGIAGYQQYDSFQTNTNTVHLKHLQESHRSLDNHNHINQDSE